MFERLFVKMIAPRIKVKMCKDGQTEFDFSTDTLILGDDLSGEDYGFRRHMEEVHGCDWVDTFGLKMWSILHEIGHYMCGQDEDNEHLMTRAMCAVINRPNDPKIQDIYFNLPDEMNATGWAIYFTSQYPKFCKIWNFILGE